MGQDSDESLDSRRRLAGLLTGAFVLVTLPRLLLHEVWRDEAWLWLTVGEARSPAALVPLLARTGQGALFPFACYVVRRLWSSVVAMQMLNLAIGAAATFVFLRFAPFPRWLRVLLVVGYFPFYEYAVISRHYALGLLLLWVACAAVDARRPLLLGAALGLLCQTTVYGILLALVVGCGALMIFRREGARSRGAAAAGVSLALSGAIAGVVQVIPAPGTSFAPGWFLSWQPERAMKVLALAWRAFVPLPLPRVDFWNSNVLDPWPGAEGVAGLAVLALAVAFLSCGRRALLLFGLGAGGFLTFAYVKLIGEMRHHGHVWLLFVAVSWLDGGLDVGLPAALRGRSWRVATLSALGFVHCAAGLFASGVDLTHPFSNGTATAALLVERGLDRHPLLGYREPPAATVALALGRPLYSPSRGLYATRPDWGPAQRDLSLPELRCSARALAHREGRDVVLVANRELPPWRELSAAGSCVGAIVRSEDYHLYVLRQALLPETELEVGCAAAP